MPEITTRDLLKGAATLIVALAWNDVGRRVVDNMFPMEAENRMMATVVYAIFVTIFVIGIINLYNITSTYVNEKLLPKKQHSGTINNVLNIDKFLNS